MTTADVQLVIEGEAVREGTIAADELGRSLISLNAAFKRANEITNGTETIADIRVKSDFRASSFDVNLILQQDVIDQVRFAFTHVDLLSAAALATLVGLYQTPDSVINLIKWVKDLVPKIQKLADGVHIEIGGDRRIYSHNTFNLYKDEPLRRALGNALQPLEHAGVDRVTFRAPDGTEVEIDREEAPYFRPGFELMGPDTPQQGERDTVLTVVRLSFISPRWSFVEMGASLSAEILDRDFFSRARAGAEKFAAGDRLHVRLAWRVTVTDGKVKAENKIVKVFRHVPAPKQLSLPSEASRH